MEKTEEVN